jgi:hypothetical protein
LNWFANVVGRAPQPRWVAVLDTSVLVPAAIAARNDTLNVKVVRAAVTSLYECVLSEYIQEETRETLQEDFGLDIGEIEAKFAPLWAKAKFVTPMPFDDPKLLKVVKGDLKDLPVLATGLAVLADEILGPLPTKFMVSNNTTDFTPGWKPFGIEFVTAQQFWHRLERGAKAKTP